MDEKTAWLKAEELFKMEEFLKIMRNVYGFNAEWDDSDNYLLVAGLETFATFANRYHFHSEFKRQSPDEMISAVLKQMKEVNKTAVVNAIGVVVKLPKVESLEELKLRLELDGIDWNQRILCGCLGEREKYPSIFP